MSTYGSFNIKGQEELEKAIVEAYSGAKAKKIFRGAVNSGGDLVVDALKERYGKIKDKGYAQGYTADEIVRSNARSSADNITLKVGWNGPHDRWRLVHLEEFGYTRHGKQYRPPQMGVIDKTVKETQSPYFGEVARKMKEAL